MSRSFLTDRMYAVFAHTMQDLHSITKVTRYAIFAINYCYILFYELGTPHANGIIINGKYLALISAKEGAIELIK